MTNEKKLQNETLYGYLLTYLLTHSVVN